MQRKIRFHWSQFLDVYDKGVALLKEKNATVSVINAQLTAIQAKWSWLTSLTVCYEQHLADALNIKAFLEEAEYFSDQMEQQTALLETNCSQTNFTNLKENEKLLKELNEFKETLDLLNGSLMSVRDRSKLISPLWQRNERINRPVAVTALCDYKKQNVSCI